MGKGNNSHRKETKKPKQEKAKPGTAIKIARPAK